jgi:tetratricopeptide (TPR) repeat protein
MRLRSVVAVLVLVVSLVPAGVATPSAQSEYRSMVEEYRSGRRGVLDKVGAADAAQIDGWLELARSTDGKAWDWETLRAAAIMHTEAWSAALRDQRNDAAKLHLETSIRLFERVRDLAPPQSDFIDRWRTVVSGLLRKTVNKGLADDFDQRTAPSFPADTARQAAMRSFLLGLEAERDASSAFVPSDYIASASFGMRQQSWASALTAYQDARQRNPDDKLTLLHLGRVRMRLNSWADARRDFTQAATASDPRVRYLALLFLGSIAERDGKYNEAEQSYLEAMKTYPLGQAWSLALSQLLSRTGREAEARKAIEVLGSRKGNVVEPLWTYLPPPALDVVDLQMSFNELRAEVVK